MKKAQKPKIKKQVWNKGKAVGQKSPFTSEQAKIIRALLAQENKIRDLALFKALSH